MLCKFLISWTDSFRLLTFSIAVCFIFGHMYPWFIIMMCQNTTCARNNADLLLAILYLHNFYIKTIFMKVIFKNSFLRSEATI